MPATEPRVIQGHTFHISMPYAPGPHTLTDAEARTLNQTRAENIGNNFRRRIKEALAPESVELSAEAYGAIAADLTAYDAEYVFAMPSSGGGSTSRVMNPIEREALNIATLSLKKSIKDKYGKDGISKYWGRDVTDEDRAKRDAKLEEIASRDAVIAQAKATVKAREKGVNAASGADADLLDA